MMMMMMMMTMIVLPDENWGVAPSLFPLNLQNESVRNPPKVSDFRKPKKSFRFAEA